LLLALGDSFTAVRYEGDKPWALQLAGMLNCDLRLIAKEGASNNYIFKNFYKAIHLEKFTHCVVALSNWDRLEIGAHKSGYQDTADRTKITKPKMILKKPKLWPLFVDAYDAKFYYDITIANILAIQSLCEYMNINLRIIQPIYPFHDSTWDLVQKVKGTTKSFAQMDLISYIDTCDVFNQIDKSKVVGYDFSSINIAGKHQNPEDMLQHFVGQNIGGNVLGFHSKQINDSNIDYTKEFDYHPTHKGHKLIAEAVYESFNS